MIKMGTLFGLLLLQRMLYNLASPRTDLIYFLK